MDKALKKASDWCAERIERFDSIADFRHAIESRSLNKGWERYSHELHSVTNESTRKWDGNVATPQAAWDMAQAGYPEAVKKSQEYVTDELRKIGFMGEGKKAIPRNYYAGGSPNVTRAMLGLPRDMRQYHKEPSKVKTIHLAYQASYSCGNSLDDIMQAGAKVIALVQALEKLEYSVQLSVVNLEDVSGIKGGFELKLKSYDNPLDIQKAAYFFAHPSFLRRIGFQWIERYPLYTQHDYGYGYPNDRELLDNVSKWMEARGGHFVSFNEMKGADLEQWLIENNYLKN